MRNHLIKSIIFYLPIIILSSCRKESTNSNGLKHSTIHLNQSVELNKWKNELVENHVVGNPCDFVPYTDMEKQKKWEKQNINCSDGLPINKNEYKFSRFDFDNDGKKDLLMHFTATNCTGHNSYSPTYAKIVYANGNSNSKLMDEIITSIIKEYNLERTTNKNLKEITDMYMQEHTTISFNNNIINGNFFLYLIEDGHCCPSYEGTYIYDVKNRKTKIDYHKRTIPDSDDLK